MKSLLYFAFIVLSCSPIQVMADAFRFAVVPQQSAHKLAALWLPILEHLEKETGMAFSFHTAPNIPEFEKRLLNQQYDVAYMNPYHYTVYGGEKGYRAIAKAKDKKIKGIIVVHKDSEYQTIDDLAKQSLAFPAPAAFAASVLPRAELNRQNIPFELNYVQTHDSVYLTVYRGLYQAGGGVMRTFLSMPPSVQSQLRVLWTSPGYTPHAIAVRSNMSNASALKIQQALIAMNENERGLLLLKNLRLKGFEVAQHEDWDDVRALGLGLLRQLQQ